MPRLIALIDGYNFYHPLERHYQKTGENYKWLNYSALFKQYINADKRFQNCTLVKTYFFTAIAKHRGAESIERHLRYIQALETVNVEVIQGNFKKKDRECRKCHHKWQGNEEKETDVKIAVKLFELAMLDTFDVCFVCSADSDLVPAIEAVRKHFPDKMMVLVTPPMHVHVEKLRSLCRDPQTGHILHIQTKLKTLKNFQFPSTIELPNGKRIHSPYVLTSKPIN